MVSKSFDFLFDVGGPNGYLVHKILPEFCARTGATAKYVPILLGGLFKATGNSAPMMRYRDAPAKWAYEQLEFQRFIAAHAIPFRMNPHFPPNSLTAMRALVGAEREGLLMPATDAIMAGAWEEGVDLSDPSAIAACFDAAGLDGAKLIALAADAEVKAKLVANTEAAVARGAFGIPTFYVGDEMFWGKERLAQVEAALA
jgi:2-hydroxychromene-2-carboxylate isomerase